MNEVWIPIVGSISLFSMIAFIVWTTSKTRARVTEMRTAFQTRMIDKFSTAAEFVDFATQLLAHFLDHGLLLTL